jgi:ribosomal protein S18 acetylase RimI-like enzyme
MMMIDGTVVDDIRIRPAVAEDSALLAGIHVDSWRAAYHEFVPAATLQRFDYPMREKAFRKALATGAEETYVASVGRDSVAILTIGAARDADLPNSTGEIWGIYITPGYWRRGIGTRLVAEAERMLMSRGCRRAVLWVLEGNQQARQFYEAMGFTADGASKQIDWGTPLKAVRYAKALRPKETREC